MVSFCFAIGCSRVEIWAVNHLPSAIIWLAGFAKRAILHHIQLFQICFYCLVRDERPSSSITIWLDDQRKYTDDLKYSCLLANNCLFYFLNSLDMRNHTLMFPQEPRCSQSVTFQKSECPANAQMGGEGCFQLIGALAAIFAWRGWYKTCSRASRTFKSLFFPGSLWVLFALGS